MSFVICCLDSACIILVGAIPEIQRPLLASASAHASLSLTRVHTTEDRLSHWNVYFKISQESTVEQIRRVFDDNWRIISIVLHKNICCGYALESPHCSPQKTYVVGTHKNRLAEAILMSTHNRGFYEKIVPKLSSNTLLICFIESKVLVIPSHSPRQMFSRDSAQLSDITQKRYLRGFSTR